MPKRTVRAPAQHHLAILEEVLETISRTLELKDILRKVVEIIGRVTKADSCLLYLISDREVVLQASLNPHPRLNQIRMKFGEGITGWVAEEKRTVAIARRAYDDPRFKQFNALPEDRYEAFLSVPIWYQGKVIGVINVQHRRPHRHAKAEVKLLETVGKQIGGLLQIVQLVSETQALQEALETRKLISRAKAILMKQHGLDEAAAHQLLLKKSMDKRKSLKEVAEAVILAAEF
ncbi:MAG: ANTAR domain-containing protein [Patescibacteria group bacterium]|nr:ANTAR domain-containing protein [Patescibacteria group bacterium]